MQTQKHGNGSDNMSAMQEPSTSISPQGKFENVVLEQRMTRLEERFDFESKARLKNTNIPIGGIKSPLGNALNPAKDNEVSPLSKEYVTQNDLNTLEEKMDLKIKVAIIPLESKIDRLGNQISNLPTTFENLLFKEREYQEAKRKETQRFFWGTIGIGVVGALIGIASILVPILSK